MSQTSLSRRIADFLFDHRTKFSLVLAILVAWGIQVGFQAALRRSAAVDSLAGIRPGPAGTPLKVLDPRMDIWFHQEDRALAAFRRIEEGFVGEDHILLVYEEARDPLGVFGLSALEAVERLSRELEKVPGVRHVRSLTTMPWIRWGEIQGSGDGPSEPGLIVTDLFQGSIQDLSEAKRIERMVAVLGGRRAEAVLGEARLKEAMGEDFDPAQHLGEPGYLGTLLSEDAHFGAIQVQVLRRRPSPQEVERAFSPGDPGALVGGKLAAAEGQFRTLQGIDRVLRIEAGLAIASTGQRALRNWIEKQEDPEERVLWEQRVEDPTSNYLEGPDGDWVRLWDEFEVDSSGGLTYRETGEPAPKGFEPKPKSLYRFRAVGAPYFNRNFLEVGQRDMKFFLLMFLVVGLTLFGIFRSAAGVVLPLSVIGVSVLASFSLAWALGDFLDNLTAVTPNMLTAVGMGDAIHLLASYALYRSRGGWASSQELVREVVRANSLPVFLTSVTTAIGFASLAWTGMLPLVKLSYVASFGVLVCYLFSMTWIPMVLCWLPVSETTGESKEKLVEGSSIQKISPWVKDYVTKILDRRRLILGLASGITFLALVGVLRIEVDSDPRTQLPPDNPLLHDFSYVEEHLGGTGDLELLFRSSAKRVDAAELQGLRARQAELAIATEEGREPDPGLTRAEVEARLEQIQRVRIGVSPEFLDPLARFVDRLRQESRDPASPLRILTGISSPLDVLRKIHQVQNQNRAEHYRIPTAADVPEAARDPQLEFDEILEEWSYLPGQDASTLIAQYYLQYEAGARPGENLSTQLSSDRQEFRVQGRLEQAPYKVTLGAIDRIEEIAREEFPQLAGSPEQVRDGLALSELDVTGQTRLFTEVGRRFILTFLESISVALLLITLVIGLTFRSLRLAFISLIPNVLPIALPLGLFGLFGFPLGPAVVLVASIALGVCVDDTIHFFTKFSRAQARGLPVRESLEYSLSEVGGALTSTSLVLILGFFALQFSDFRISQMMGRLAVTMIALAWVADLVVTPVVLFLFSPSNPDSTEESP